MFVLSIIINELTKSCKIKIAFYEEGKILTNFRKTEYWKRKFSWILYIDNYKENEIVFF